jgi:hypothetical protein
VPEAGLEPAGPCEHRILSAARLPISPLRQTQGPILACSRQPKKRLRSCPLARQARNRRCVVEPGQQSAGFSSSVAQHPVGPSRTRHSLRDRPVDVNESEQGGSEPIDKQSTGGHERDIQTFIDVPWILAAVVAIHVHNDGSIAIDASTSEVREVLIRDGEWPDGSTLCGRETNAFDPPGEAPITPLDPVASTMGPHPPHRSLKRQTCPQHIKKIRIRGGHREMPTILGEISVGGEQTDRVGELARPTVDSPLTRSRTARAGIETVRAKSTTDGRCAAAEPLRDVLRGEALVSV